ncbi:MULTISPECIES: response regulator transcription factor [Halanaerobium]|uniref:Stage 0 sporulation protein A homolog n=1 Tax=Halanaerobium kushneri TaxID=56779 RepID=A0A1N6XBR8_9FIRM|nr:MULTISPECIES: response regulator transcription factor [Halanaerobium]RCW62052.1 DNA-binding response OmpR family regulator [Halanaerobium sp. ST460_2HS_T2]SIQ99804.1 DNA-binding response regulator, OmpR family, contains REC and winged-helix (wHTH) domain [Halanaerobium kushneri]
MKILIVEDEKDLAKIIKKRLERENYTADIVYDGEEAIDKTIVNEYDLIILDIMIPKKSGLEVLRELRDWEDKTPVLILTARDSLEDKVKGLNMGADDYLTKPFAFEELTARIKTIFRRGVKEHSNILKNGDLILNTIDYSVKRADKVIELTSKEYAVLEYLMRNRGHILSRSQIEEHVWGYMSGNNTNIVDVYIRFLRKKIDDQHEIKLLETVRGRGYRMKVIKDE